LLLVFCEKKALVIKERRRFDFYEKRDIFESFFLIIIIRRRLCYIVVFGIAKCSRGAEDVLLKREFRRV